MADQEYCPKCYNPISTSRGDRGSQGVDEYGDPFPFWSNDPILTPLGLSGTEYKGIQLPKANELKELRDYYNSLESDLGLEETTWTDDLSDVNNNFILKAIHINELRKAIEVLLLAKNLTIEDYFAFDRYGNPIITDQTDWTDVDRDNVDSFPLLPTQTLIKAIHIEELRRGIVSSIFAEEGLILPTVMEVTYEGTATSGLWFSSSIFGSNSSFKEKTTTHCINNYKYTSHVYPGGSHEFENSVEDIYTFGSPVLPILEKLEETKDNYKFKITNNISVNYYNPTYIQLYIKLTPENPVNPEYSNAIIPFHNNTTNKIYGSLYYTYIGDSEWEALIVFRYLESHTIYLPKPLSYKYPYLKFNSATCAGYTVDVDTEFDIYGGDITAQSGNMYLPIGGCYVRATELSGTRYYNIQLQAGFTTDYISTGYTWIGSQYDYNTDALKSIISGMSQWDNWLSGEFSLDFAAKGLLLDPDPTQLIPFDFTISGASL